MQSSITKTNQKHNAIIDIAKLFFALLVVGIHTEPFGFSFWLDKGFGIITRLCVPFFFVTSSYFFFQKGSKPLKYVARLVGLYAIWCFLYLALNFTSVISIPFPQLIVHYFWDGHDVLWYLLASVIGFVITYALSRIARPKIVLIVGALFLLIGCIKSTYSSVLENMLNVDIPNALGSRNGLFYGFPYYALGLFIAKKEPRENANRARCLIGLIVCLCLLVAESALFTIIFKATSTVLWLTAFPLTYYLLMVLNQISIPLAYKPSLVIRKTSTLIYVVHPFFLRAFDNFSFLPYFLMVSTASILVSLLLIYLSNKRFFKWLQVLF